MAIILSCENCIGQRFDFIQHEGEILTKPKGSQTEGTLMLQQQEQGSDKLRITFNAVENLLSSLLGAFIPFADSLCHFDFSQHELRTGTKQIKLVQWMTGIPPFTYTLQCYDFSKGEGRAYIFPDEENAKMWAIEIGITEMETQTIEGELVKKEQF